MAKQGAPQRLPSPNPKYPFVGPNYMQYGEQPGYVYYPWSDEYYVDPKAVQQYGESTGLVEKPKQPPGLAEQLLPVGLGIGATFAAKEVGTAIGKEIGGVFGPEEVATDIVTDVIPAAGGGVATAGGVLGSASGVGAGGATTGSSIGVGGGSAAGRLAGSIPASGGSGASGAFSLGGVGSPGNAILPIAGAVGLGDVILNQRTGVRGVAQGAASGAAIGSFFPGPGTAIGAVVGGLIGLGNTLFKDKDQWKTEGNRLKKLKENGVYIPDTLIEQLPTQGRSKEELVDQTVPQDFVGFTDTGKWVNNRFAKSRNVADLRGEDLANYSAWAEKYPDWFRKPLEERFAIGNRALAAGAIKEHHGTIDIDFSKFDPSKASEDDMKLPSNVKGMPKPVPGQQKQSLQQMGQQYGERPIQTLREVPKVPPPQSEQAFREMVVQNGLQGAPQAAPQNRAPVAAPQPSGLFGIASKPVALPPGRNQLYSQPGVRQALDQMRNNRR